MKPLLLSIIVPVYRVEKYVVECIHSIIKQLDEDFELIIVNDGSPDRSVELIEAYLAEIHNPDLRTRIQLVQQENRGVAVARNKGIALAQGQYLTFVDSDDLWLDNAAQVIRQALVRRDRPDIDLFAFSFKICDEALNFKSHRTELPHIPRMPEIITDNPLRLLLTSSVWSKLFSRNLIESWQIRFPTGLRFEDLYFTFLASLHAKAIAVSDESIYAYRVNSDSFMQSYSSKVAPDLLTAIVLIKKYMRTSEYSDLLPYLELIAISHCYLEYEWKFHGQNNRELRLKLVSDFKREFPNYRKNPHLHLLDWRLKLRFYAAQLHLTPVIIWVLRYGSMVKSKLRKALGK